MQKAYKKLNVSGGRYIPFLPLSGCHSNMQLAYISIMDCLHSFYIIASEVLDNHKSVLTSFGIQTNNEELDLPYIYWIPKMHKNLYKHRFIAGSSKCSTKPIGRDGQLHTSLYDKRDDFNFHITNFPFLSSNIPSSPAYGVFISQLIRYARACFSYECFILRALRLSNKLLGQGYVKERLRSSLRKFYGRYGDLIKQYEVPLSRMLHDILDDDHLQWHPPLIRHYTNFWPYCWSWPYYRIWLFT